MKELGVRKCEKKNDLLILAARDSSSMELVRQFTLPPFATRAVYVAEESFPTLPSWIFFLYDLYCAP